jgi:hypothetical protein
MDQAGVDRQVVSLGPPMVHLTFLSERDRARILGENVERFLGLDRGRL